MQIVDSSLNLRSERSQFITFSHLSQSALSIPRVQDLVKRPLSYWQADNYSCQEDDTSSHLSRPVLGFASYGLVVTNLAIFYKLSVCLFCVYILSTTTLKCACPDIKIPFFSLVLIHICFFFFLFFLVLDSLFIILLPSCLLLSLFAGAIQG